MTGQQLLAARQEESLPLNHASPPDVALGSGVTASQERRLFGPVGLAWYNKKSDLFLWDVATGSLIRKLPCPIADPLSVAVSPDGKRYLAGGNDKVIHLYDLATVQELARLQGHEDQCHGLFSPDGKRILTYNLDKTLCLWDADSGKLHHKLGGRTGRCASRRRPRAK